MPRAPRFSPHPTYPCSVGGSFLAHVNVAFFTVMLFVAPAGRHQRKHVRRRRSHGLRLSSRLLLFVFPYQVVQLQRLDTHARHYLITSVTVSEELQPAALEAASTHRAERNHDRALPLKDRRPLNLGEPGCPPRGLPHSFLGASGSSGGGAGAGAG